LSLNSTWDADSNLNSTADADWNSKKESESRLKWSYSFFSGFQAEARLELAFAAEMVLVLFEQVKKDYFVLFALLRFPFRPILQVLSNPLVSVLKPLPMRCRNMGHFATRETCFQVVSERFETSKEVHDCQIGFLFDCQQVAADLLRHPQKRQIL